MNHSHLKNLLNLGFLVDEGIKDAVEDINEEDFYKLIEYLKSENVFMLDGNVLKNALSKDVNILKKFERKESFNINDIVKKLNEKYVFLQSILIKKMELSNILSINKCSSGDVSVIGLVKAKEEQKDNFLISLEDPTGEMMTIIPKKLGEKIALDDVIAVSGRIDNKNLIAYKLLFPDTPLKPVVYNRDSVRVAFLPNNKVDADYIVFNDKIEDKIKNKEYRITNPCIFKIGDVIFLLILDYDPLEVLKKRYVNIENNNFLIDPTPDIVFSDKSIDTNYKGISIVSPNKIIDLKTREIKS